MAKILREDMKIGKNLKGGRFAFDTFFSKIVLGMGLVS